VLQNVFPTLSVANNGVIANTDTNHLVFIAQNSAGPGNITLPAATTAGQIVMVVPQIVLDNTKIVTIRAPSGNLIFDDSNSFGFAGQSQVTTNNWKGFISDGNHNWLVY